MFFSLHPVMVQIMSFDIKIHHISNDSKHMQCLDMISSEKVSYHLHCRKYDDNSGDNEYVLFFSLNPAMVQIMSFYTKIHQISNNRKHMQCFDFIGSNKVHCHLYCRKFPDNSGDNENILGFSKCIQLWFKSCPLTSKFIKFQIIGSTSSVLTSLRRTKIIITCIVVNILKILVIMKMYYVFPIASSYGSSHVLGHQNSSNFNS